jgi:pimeloyl-ACP methyl ester carboxylesterase
MAGLVEAIDSLLPAIGAGPRLAVLVGAGMAAYAAMLFACARPIVDEVLGLIRPGKAAAV